MNKIVVSVRDLKSKEYLYLLHFKTPDEAKRFYTDVLKDPRSVINKHPRDYALHQIATFNTESGVMTPQLMEDHTPYDVLDNMDRGTPGNSSTS